MITHKTTESHTTGPETQIKTENTHQKGTEKIMIFSNYLTLRRKGKKDDSNKKKTNQI